MHRTHSFIQLETNKLWFNGSKYTEGEARELIFVLENIAEIDNFYRQYQ